MIPYAILAGQIQLSAEALPPENMPLADRSWETVCEFRILELAPEWFTFRLAVQDGSSVYDLSEDRTKRPERFVLSFFCREGGLYHPVILYCGAEITDILNEGMEPDEAGIRYRVNVNSQEYRSRAEVLSKEYLRYISLKMEEDDAGLSQELTGYPAEQEKEYPLSFKQQKREWFSGDAQGWGNGSESCCKPGVELGIELDQPTWYRLFSELPFLQFLDAYWKKSGLGKHPVKKMEVSALYIGNQYCPHLFPQKEELFGLLEKAGKERLRAVLMFSWVQEQDMIKIEEILDRLSNWCSGHRCRLELVINDWGMAWLLRQKSYSCFDLTLGVLLAKQRRDSRMSYKTGIDPYRKELGLGPLQTDFYRKYLKEHFGFSRVSVQSCGYEPSLKALQGSLDVTLHFPFYQMNTSQYCPLLACIRYGDRGKQEPVRQCRQECLEQSFLYPKLLSMTGRYNTLFGVDKSIIIDNKALQRYLEQGVDRIVAGFL